MAYYVIIRGPLGIGKSTISKKVAKELNAEYMSVDKILDEFGLTKDKEAGYISQKSFLKTNEIAIRRALPYLEKGRNVIFDGNFYWESQIKDLVDKLKFKGYIFTLKASVETCIQRDILRGRTHGEDAARAVYKKSTSFDIGNPIIVEGKDENECVEEILNILEQKNEI